MRWDAISLDSRRSRRPSSPACGVRTVGVLAACKQVEAPGEGVEPVGVDDERDLDLLDQRADEVLDLHASPDPRPEHHRGGALGRLEDRVGRSGGEAPLLTRAADRHHLGQLHLEDRLELTRNGDRRVARSGARRSGRRHAYGARQPARAADDQHLAGAELRRVGPAPGKRLEHLGAHQSSGR